MSRKLTSFAGIKKGQKFRVIKNIGSHNYPLNVPLTFRVDGTDGSTMGNIAESKNGGDYNNIRIDEIQLYNETVVDMREQLNLIKSKSNSEFLNLTEKIRICEELNLETYDEFFIMIHQSLVVLGANATLLEKTKALISIIENKQ
jgi:hypothetical protein